MTTKQLESFVRFCDVAIFFSLCVLIFFLPISIAAVEIFTIFSFFFLILKRAGVFLINKDISKAFSLPSTILNKPLLVWCFFVILSIIFSQFKILGFIGFWGKVFEGIVVFFVVVENLNSCNRLYMFLSAMLAGGLLTVSSGIGQWLTGVDFIRHNIIPDGRLTSSLRAPNDFGVYLVVLIPVIFSLALFLPSENKCKSKNHLWNFFSNNKLKIFLMSLMPLFLICLGLTFSRGGWLALILTLVIIGFRSKTLIFYLMIGFLFFISCFVPQMIEHRTQMSAINLFSSFGRNEYWVEALHIIQDHPIFGVGLNAYSQVGKLYKINWGGYPHNCYLQMAAEIGIPGLLAFLWVIWTLFSFISKSLKIIEDNTLKTILVGVLAGFSGFLFQSFFDTFFYSSQLGTLLWVLIGLLVAICRLDQLQRSYRKASENI